MSLVVRATKRFEYYFCEVVLDCLFPRVEFRLRDSCFRGLNNITVANPFSLISVSPPYFFQVNFPTR